MKKNILIGIVVVMVLLAIAAGYFLVARPPAQKPLAPAAEDNPPAPATAEKIIPAPKAETITPLKLEYTLKNFGPGKSIDIAYYFEKKQQCAGRDAYLGIVKIETIDARPANQFAKFAAFADNGELGISNWSNEENLAFDNAAAYYDDMNIPLLVSELFIAVGKNFRDPQYWQSDTPIILKNVETGRSKGDYLIVNLGDDNSATVPCTKFKIVAKTTNMDGYFTVCVAKKIGEVNLPFVVYMNFQNEQGPSWKLTNITSEKSGVAWTPQCLNAPKCAYVADPTPAERNQCRQTGGQINADMDQSGCIIKYQCQSESDQAIAAIARTQNPSCGINQKLLEKYLLCRKNNQSNYDPVEYDDSGCLSDITCRP
jgi:hypothetical protein